MGFCVGGLIAFRFRCGVAKGAVRCAWQHGHLLALVRKRVLSSMALLVCVCVCVLVYFLPEGLVFAVSEQHIFESPALAQAFFVRDTSAGHNPRFGEVQARESAT